MIAQRIAGVSAIFTAGHLLRRADDAVHHAASADESLLAGPAFGCLVVPTVRFTIVGAASLQCDFIELFALPLLEEQLKNEQL